MPIQSFSDAKLGLGLRLAATFVFVVVLLEIIDTLFSRTKSRVVCGDVVGTTFFGSLFKKKPSTGPYVGQVFHEKPTEEPTGPAKPDSGQVFHEEPTEEPTEEPNMAYWNSLLKLQSPDSYHDPDKFLGKYYKKETNLLKNMFGDSDLYNQIMKKARNEIEVYVNSNQMVLQDDTYVQTEQTKGYVDELRMTKDHDTYTRALTNTIAGFAEQMSGRKILELTHSALEDYRSKRQTKRKGFFVHVVKGLVGSNKSGSPDNRQLTNTNYGHNDPGHNLYTGSGENPEGGGNEEGGNNPDNNAQVQVDDELVEAAVMDIFSLALANDTPAPTTPAPTTAAPTTTAPTNDMHFRQYLNAHEKINKNELEMFNTIQNKYDSYFKMDYESLMTLWNDRMNQWYTMNIGGLMTNVDAEGNTSVYENDDLERSYLDMVAMSVAIEDMVPQTEPIAIHVVNSILGNTGPHISPIHSQGNNNQESLNMGASDASNLYWNVMTLDHHIHGMNGPTPPGPGPDPSSSSNQPPPNCDSVSGDDGQCTPRSGGSAQERRTQETEGELTSGNVESLTQELMQPYMDDSRISKSDYDNMYKGVMQNVTKTIIDDNLGRTSVYDEPVKPLTEEQRVDMKGIEDHFAGWATVDNQPWWNDDTFGTDGMDGMLTKMSENTREANNKRHKERKDALIKHVWTQP